MTKEKWEQEEAEEANNAVFHLPQRSELGTGNDITHKLNVFQYSE